MSFLALIIGCLECMESSVSLGIYATPEAAREACAEWFRSSGNLPDGDQFATWVLDLSAQTVHE